MWAPPPPEPPAPGWWTEHAERQAEADLVEWAGRVDGEVRVRRAAADERAARQARVRLGSAMRACRVQGHPSCAASHGPCVHPALAAARPPVWWED